MVLIRPTKLFSYLYFLADRSSFFFVFRVDQARFSAFPPAGKQQGTWSSIQSQAVTGDACGDAGWEHTRFVLLLMIRSLRTDFKHC